ncbi:MAG TPA: FecR domain-containing protein [Candidatus Eisenbacteria bacterium]|jgi:hypothetical protein|nr:FecR domain-containing protein [Candidatus Eisenbacteria bacterium]
MRNLTVRRGSQARAYGATARAAGLAAALAALTLWPALASADAPYAALTKVQGDVQIVRGGQSSAAKEGAQLEPGDVVRTGPDGTADLSLDALAGCRVLPASECGISEHKKNEMRLKLSGGRAIFNLEKLPIDAEFKVETPTAIASVRGTQFSGNVLMGPRGARTTFSVRDDAIQILRLEGGKPVGDPVTVSAGFSCDISAGDFRTLTARQATGAELTVMEQSGSVKTCG